MAEPQPTRLGRYQILEEIGKGSMGVVYLARDPLIGRLVALKTFRLAEPSDQELAESRERFIREAQSAGILSHPNIVTVHDVVEVSDEGTTCIAMEYVRGTDLKELLRRDEPLDISEVSEFIWQVAEALEYAHSKGVVHRDIKPANILITGDGRVKLTDFGIARLNTSNLTHAGQLLGTPNYMAPEQIRGIEVDHRADIFSLGVVLYEMLTRHKPFRGDNLTMVTHRIVHEPFTPIEDYVSDLPAGMRPVIERALAKQPENRYQRVGELARDLKKIADEVAQQAALNDTQELPAFEELDDTLPPGARAAAAAAPGGPETGLPAAATPVAATVSAALPGPTVELILAPLVAALSPEPVPVVAPILPSIPAPSTPVASLSVPSLPPLPPATPVAPARRPPAAQRAFSWVRALAASAVALVLTLTLGIVALAMMQPEDSGKADRSTDRTISERFQVLPLVFSARELLAQGDPLAAVEALRQAELQAPDSTRIRDLRIEAERQAADQVASAGLDDQLRRLLSQGEQALARSRYREATDLAKRALVLEPGSPSALDLLARAQGAASRARITTGEAEEATTPAVVATDTAPSLVEPAVPEPVPAAAATTAGRETTLLLAFHSQQSQGILTVYLGQRQLLREPFKFTQKTGFLRSKGVAGSFERTLTVPTGQHQLRIYVALDKTHTETVEGNFLDGMTRTLDVTVGAVGELVVSLR